MATRRRIGDTLPTINVSNARPPSVSADPGPYIVPGTGGIGMTTDASQLYNRAGGTAPISAVGGRRNAPAGNPRSPNAIPTGIGTAPPIAPRITMPLRSNAGGALRGEARASQVKAMNAARKAAQNTPEAIRRQARLRRRQALSFRPSVRG